MAIQDILKPGTRWPLDKVNARNLEYDRLLSLYESKHSKSFLEYTFPENSRPISVPYPRLIAHIHRDMLFRAKIRYMAGDEPEETQKAINRIIKQTKLNRTLREAALVASIYGDAYLRVGVDFIGKPKTDHGVSIDNVNPRLIVPIFDSKDESVARELWVTWMVSIGDTKEKRAFLFVEIHREGEIELHKYLFKPQSNEIEMEVDLDPEDGEAISPLPNKNMQGVYHVPNRSDGLGYYGCSDFSGIDDLFREIDNRATRVSRILDVFSSPKLKLPIDAANEDKEGNLVFSVEEVIPIPPDTNGDAISYLTWDARLEAAENQMEWLKQMAFLGSDTSEAAFGIGVEAGASGTAIWLRMSRTLLAADVKEDYWTEAISEILFAAQALEIANGGGTYEPIRPTIELQTGLPTDRETAVRVAAEMKLNGFATEAMAILIANPGITPEDVNGMLDTIKKEKAANNPPPTSALDQFRQRSKAKADDKAGGNLNARPSA